MTSENAIAATSVDATYASLWRFGASLSQSELVPAHYQGKPANCFIAVDFARHMGLPVLAVMRGTHVVKGKLGFAAEFVIARINSSGKFDEPVSYDESGTPGEDDYRVRAGAPIKGKMFWGPWVTWAMVVAEGWASNPKYKSMPDVMMPYRAATFFGRRYAPETLFGMQTVEELEDLDAAGQLPRDVQAESAADAINAELEAASEPEGDAERSEEDAHVDALAEQDEDMRVWAQGEAS